MTIFFITTTFREVNNGPSKFANLLLDLNDRPDINFHLITEDVDKDKVVSNIHKVTLSDQTIKSRMGMIARIKDYTKAVIRLSLDHKPDIIVCNNAILGEKLYRLSVPCLGMINDYNSISLSMSKPNFSYSFIRLLVFRYFEKKAVRRATGIITNSNIMRDMLVKTYGANPSKVFRLYKAVDITINSYNKSSIEEEISILFVKADFMRGGLLDLIKAVNILNLEITINIVGPTKVDFNKIREYNSNKKTILNFHGRLSQNAVFELMQSSTIFCTPSLTEALGVANMEALIHKLPVVYTDVGGIPEVMNYGKNGFVAQPNNPKSLAMAIKRALSCEKERLIRSQLGYLFIKQNFNKETMLNNFVDICRKVV